MKKRPRAQRHDERWLITYADLVTLLLAFFIIMYSLSKVDVEKFQNLSVSLSKAMGAGGSVLESPGPSVVPGAGEVYQDSMKALEIKQMENIMDKMNKYIKDSNLQNKARVVSEERGLVLSFQGEVLFKMGSAELTSSATDILYEVGPLIREIPNYIRVEGHTDSFPISTDKYPSNWELSAARSNEVAKKLINVYKTSPERISFVGYGQYRPVVMNDTEENRQINRRVDIVILASKYAPSEAAGPLRMTGQQ